MLAPNFIKVLTSSYRRMKGLIQIFTAMLVTLVSQAGFADDLSDVARAAARRDATAVAPGSGRQKAVPDQKNTTTSVRTTTTSRDSGAVRERSGVGQTTQRSATVGKNVVSRAATNTTVARKPIATPERNVATRSGATPKNAQASRTGATARTGALTARSMLTSTPVRHGRATSIARNGAPTPEVAAITSRDFKSCRDVFQNCMDEFCANKDATLKRCACSARAREFDGMKKQLAQVEDKLLDFSQRLLTVNMDKEDVIALNQATEGELGYDQKDKSESKKMLDQIAKKLNTSFNNSNFDQNLNAISLSLNTDTAFDNIDSLMGATTTTKSGTALYNAALPVCREMALEVCTEQDLKIAESGYQMTIEQDCNTVAKAYASQNDQARAKILESSALLDMSRLDIHQKRNSDDILTCKKKMLDMLTDSTVCGTGMSKCLDISGRYIDPTTGEAFLTDGLINLGNLITRPTTDQTWAGAPGNLKFVQYLDNKRKFIAPASEGCQDIADYVWQEFLEDALAQIKLAQEEKLEQVRQSCTTLTTQCLDDTFKSISEFDARALSIFGVSADKTVNAICNDVRTACTALLNSTNGDTAWDMGMTEIITDKTYETILATCREVGRQCIIRSCKSVSGNFGLCENIDTSVNRKSIISRHSCWDEVSQCVADAGAETINTIMENRGRTANTLIDYASTGDIYEDLYGFGRSSQMTMAADAETTISYTHIYDWCGQADSAKLSTEFDWQVCRLTEQIWGNCEYAPGTTLSNDDAHNMILINNTSADDDNETLLSWFARNTGTENSPESCRDTTCGAGTTNHNGICVSNSDFSSDNEYCPTNQFNIFGAHTNCCASPAKLHNKNLCCRDGAVIAKITPVTNYAKSNDVTDLSNTITYMCTFGNFEYAYALATDDSGLLVCLSEMANEAAAITYSASDITCNGYFVYLHANGEHVMPTKTGGIDNYYTNTDADVCRYNYDVNGGTNWLFNNPESGPGVCTMPNDGWSVRYNVGV